MIRIVVEIGNESLSSLEYRFDNSPVRLGRAGNCHVQLPMDSVSLHHLSFARGERGWKVVDEGSTNGTRVNGVVIEPGVHKELTCGDRIQILDVAMRVMMDDAAVGLTPTTPEESGQLARKMIEKMLAAPPRHASAYLEVLAGRDIGARVDLTASLTTVAGLAGPEGAWRLSDPGLTGVAFTVRSYQGRFLLERAGGALRNDVPWTASVPICSGDRVTVADTTLLFFDALEEYFSGELQIAEHHDQAAAELAPSATMDPEGGDSLWGPLETGLLAVAIVLLVLAVVVGVVLLGGGQF